ncbi:MAG: DUF1501 domain-containing protein [Pseudomonadota bacterium]
MNRRNFLHTAALLPFVANPIAWADLPKGSTSRRARRVVLIRLAGGNDGLNALVPYRDDFYYRNRPNIAIPANTLLTLDGRDQGLNPALASFKELMEEGWAGLIQNVGYPNASRSHRRATEIWSTGTDLRPSPETGWLGRWADASTTPDQILGFTLGQAPARAFASAASRTELVSSPDTLRNIQITNPKKEQTTVAKLATLRQIERRIYEYAGLFEQARSGSGHRFDYPDTEFGAAMRWIGDIIETQANTRIFHTTLGSFENGFSFDTHLDQLQAHQSLYGEFGQGLSALAKHLQKAGSWQDTLVLTYSDFGRLIAENKSGGTEHGDAGLMFIAGGSIAAGVHGQLPDLAGSTNGGINPLVDFRQVFTAVLDRWLDAPAPEIMGGVYSPYPLLA